MNGFSSRKMMARVSMWLSMALVGVVGCGMAGRRSTDVRADGKVTVHRFAAMHGFAKPTITDKQVILHSPRQSLVFFPGSRRAELDGRVVWLNAGLAKQGREYLLDPVDAQDTLIPLLAPPVELRAVRSRVIVLDPGHGGEDSGSEGRHSPDEKVLALKISNEVARELRKQGYTVHLTRSTDVFIPLEDRCEIARRLNADLMLSIHFNAGSSSAEGIETFALSLPGYASTNDNSGKGVTNQVYPGNKFNALNIFLADQIQQQLLAKTKRVDRGVKRARFAVLRDAPCPAALVECGFLTNREEGLLAASPAFQGKIVQALTEGILAYARENRKRALLAPETAAVQKSPESSIPAPVTATSASPVSRVVYLDYGTNIPEPSRVELPVRRANYIPEITMTSSRVSPVDPLEANDPEPLRIPPPVLRN